jgi:ArsR family transcriptional regulator
MDIDVSSGLFRALGHPGRLRIVELLAGHDGLAVNEIAERLEMSQPRVSSHLAALRFSGLVERERRQRQLAYRLTDDSMQQLMELVSRLAAAR